MFNKLSAAWRVFKAGESVANPTAWKRGQIKVAMLTTLFGACIGLATAFGYRIEISVETQTAIVSGILAAVGVYNQFSTAASTDRVDVLGRAPVERVRVAGGEHAVSDNTLINAEPVQGVDQRDSRPERNSGPQDFTRDSSGG